MWDNLYQVSREKKSVQNIRKQEQKMKHPFLKRK